MIHEFKVLVKTTTRTSRKDVAEMLNTCLKSSEVSMELSFAIKNISLDNHFMKNLRETKAGSSIEIPKHDRIGYANFARALGLDIVFRDHPEENKLKLYVIDTLW